MTRPPLPACSGSRAHRATNLRPFSRARSLPSRISPIRSSIGPAAGRVVTPGDEGLSGVESRAPGAGGGDGGENLPLQCAVHPVDPGELGDVRSALRDESAAVRKYAALALGLYGEDARSACPELADLSKDESAMCGGPPSARSSRSAPDRGMSPRSSRSPPIPPRTSRSGRWRRRPWAGRPGRHPASCRRSRNGCATPRRTSTGGRPSASPRSGRRAIGTLTSALNEDATARRPRSPSAPWARTCWTRFPLSGRRRRPFVMRRRAGTSPSPSRGIERAANSTVGAGGDEAGRAPAGRRGPDKTVDMRSRSSRGRGRRPRERRHSAA